MSALDIRKNIFLKFDPYRSIRFQRTASENFPKFGQIRPKLESVEHSTSFNIEDIHLDGN
jgi:hypothetical protein